MSTVRPAMTIGLVALLLATVANKASAERLFSTAEQPRTTMHIMNVRALAIDPAALAALRANGTMRITDLPLGSDVIPAVTVARFEPFATDARVAVVEPRGTRQLALPDQLYFRGRVEGDPQSVVVVIASAQTARGLVASNGTVYRFGPGGDGRHHSWALRDADPAVFDIAPPTCANDTIPIATGAGGAAASLSARGAAFSATLLTEVAIDTDEEFLRKFQSPAGALAYLADVAAVVSAIYESDVGVRIVFRFIRLWATNDPWDETVPGLMVYEVGQYWANNETAIARDTVHFISGKSPGSGAAFLDGLCNAFGYGASIVNGAFELMSPADIWDIYLVAHELGHNFGSVHTHCYQPPLDHCHNQESGCWSGGFDEPPGGGTLMSYCSIQHMNLTFGDTVSAVLRAGAEAAVCVGPPCGDGTLDAGETCDDGNVDDGDCCSADCTTAAPDGGTCDDANFCTGAGNCVAGACIAAPVADGAPCDDGKTCTSDSCIAGTCVGIPGPAAQCKQPTQALAASLMMKDVGGADSGNKLRWNWKKGAATTLAEFGDPTAENGYELCIYDAAGAAVLSEHVGAGGLCDGRACWQPISNVGFQYKDASPVGIRKLSLRSGDSGRAGITVLGKNLPMPSAGLENLTSPLRVQLHGAGSCWEARFSSPDVMTPRLFKAKSD